MKIKNISMEVAGNFGTEHMHIKSYNDTWIVTAGEHCQLTSDELTQVASLLKAIDNLNSQQGANAGVKKF